MTSLRRWAAYAPGRVRRSAARRTAARRAPARRKPALRAAAAAAIAVSLAATVSGAVALAPAAAAGARSVASAGATGTTVHGTVSGDHAWDTKHKRQFAAVPSVTVDQTTDLTDQVVHVTWNHFTPSIDQAGSFFSYGQTYYAVTVLECRGTDPRHPALWKWPDFGPDCYNFTSDDPNATHGAGNQVYTLTGPDGGGEAYFHVETGVENDFLGCDASHACSLVVVPNWGGVQEPGQAPSNKNVNCSDHSGDQGLVFGDYALDTRLGDACSWQDRIVVPLHFAPTPQTCPNRGFQFVAEGAPALGRAIDQWRAGWCTGASKLTFDFDSGTNEDLARQAFLSGSGALTNAIDVAVVNQPADAATAGQRKFVYAPIADSAITVAYHIDNARTGKLLTHLTLDARLVAKLLTQSYSLAFGCTEGDDTTKQGPTCDPAVKGNPPDIFDDPEFTKLNPDLPRGALPTVSLLNRGQFLPLVINGNSDLVYELTSWLWSDPGARAFLRGKPDQWGMHVNTYYKNEPMPTTEFQVLDPGYTAPTARNGVPGQSTMQVTWNPISGMANVANSLVVDRPSGIDPVLPPCGTNGVPCVYQRFGSQPPGKRALFAIVGSVDAAADRFPTAKLVNAAGSAVAPSDRGMRAALQNAKTDHNRVTQRIDYRSGDATQYPLTTVDYAMVPKCGLPAAKVTAIKAFLHLVTRSQHVGLLPGQLAPGQLPLTRTQRAQTKAAAEAVSTTSCTPSTPKPAHSPAPHRRTGRAPVPVAGGAGNSEFGGGATAPAPVPATSSSSSSAPVTTAAPSSTPAPESSTTQAAFGIKHSDATIGTGMVLPLTLLLAALLFIGGPAAFLALNGGGGAALAKQARSLARLRPGSHR